GFTTSYIKQNITTGAPNDYYYAIVKNSSPSSSTNPNTTMPEATALNRVFGLWDIAGDHTNATNQNIGNAPPAAAQNGGYFVLINASYNTNVAYQETVTNLCPNTYYEFSAWVRNVCSLCSFDSTGKGTRTAGFIPGPGNDSSGVLPNLNFEIDGLAFYTTGDIKYDKVNPWKKFGFTFLTRPGQTTANFAIRNNSPGGGGNDWAIDDIKISHCGPNLKMNFAPEVLGCKEGNFQVSLSDTVRSVYNSYVHFKWQKSNVGGTVWADMTGPGTSGIGSPVLVNGMFEYVTNLPTFMVSAADSGTYYRVLVATTAANLHNNCAYKDQTTTMIRAITCGIILQGDFTLFRGTLAGKQTYLSWSTSGEKDLAFYAIEKSRDGIDFGPMAALMAKNMPTASYNFTDPEPLNGKAFYRLKMTQLDGKFKYSQIIQLNSKSLFEVSNIENPFRNLIHVNVDLSEAGPVTIALHNDKGQRVKSFTQNLSRGNNKVIVPDLNYLSNGIYFIAVEYKFEIHRRKLVKQ
ncbi:MAG: T9SS type A sorting domain-containing protein, partial [Ferruginibacter sp.]